MFKRIFRWATVMILSLAFAFSASAQADDIPSPVNFALADLSQQVGQQVTLNDIWQWRWVGDVYPDASLGCPQPGEQYAQVVTNGFRFMLTYESTTYDYRVSADGAIVILCATYPVGEAPSIGAPVDETEPVAPVDPAPADPVPADSIDTAPPADLTCPEILPPRVETGEEAIVNREVPVLNVRNQPGLANPVSSQIVGGSLVTVQEGYTCVDELVWWQVQFDDSTGWVAEGRNSVYFLEPLELLTLDPADDITCTEVLPTRLEVESIARLNPEFTNVNVRAQAGLTQPIVDRILSGGTFNITGGPECGPQNLTWWEVQFGLTTGWVAEGRDNVYYIEPVDLPGDSS